MKAKKKAAKGPKKETRLEQIGWVNVGTEESLVHGYLYGSRDEAAFHAGFEAWEQVPAYIQVQTAKRSAKGKARSRPKASPSRPPKRRGP